MVDKAHVRQNMELRDERTEQAVITQLRVGLLPRVRTSVEQKLEDAFDALHGGRFSTPSGLGGARLASREVGGDVDGVDEKGPLKSAADSSRILTGAAFNSGMSMVQGNTAGDVGPKVGTKEQAFGDDDSQGSDGKASGGEIVASGSLTGEYERRQAPVYERVESIVELPFARQGGDHTLRQLTALEEVRREAKQYPGFQELDSLPASLGGVSRQAVDSIVCAALAYVAIRVDAQNQVAGQESLNRSDEILGNVSKRFIPAKWTVDIDPMKFATNGALAA
jgi:hypothetical protein